MADTNQKRHEFPLVSRSTVTLKASGVTQLNINQADMPQGLIHSFRIHVQSAALTGFSAAATDFQKVLNAITYGMANPAQVVMPGVPGLLWDRVYTALMAKATERTTPTANGFAIDYVLPFSWFNAKFMPAERPKDTACWNVAGKAKPYINLIFGPYSDLCTGTITTPDITVEVYAELEPNPVALPYNPENPALSGDLPGRMLEMIYNQKSDLSTRPDVLLVTGGDRLNHLVAEREVNSSTQAEVTDIFNKAVSTPSRIEVKYGGKNYTAGAKVEAFDRYMSDKLGAAINTSLHVWIPTKEGRVTDAVDLSPSEPFKIEHDNVSGSTRALDVLQVNSVLIPADKKAAFAATNA